MTPCITELLNQQNPRPVPALTTVVIYGAGHTGQLLAQTLRAKKIDVVAFLDRGATPGLTREGTPVLLPTEAPHLTQTPVIVAVFNRERSARYRDIAAILFEQGFTTVYSLEQYYISDPKGFPDLYWLTDPSFYKGHSAAIEAASQLWADEKSRLLYCALLRLRLTGADALPEPTPHLQYMPEDLPLRPPPYRFVDIGAFDGDTLSALRQQKGLFESIFAFEPDMNNFRALAHRVETEGPFSTGVTCLFPCGVGQQCDTVSFVSDGSEAAKVSLAPAKTTVQTPIVPIDAVLHQSQPTYIKIDVEGFEEEVLCGLKKLLERDRPMLALCVYHKPADLFLLPLLLASWDYPVDFYLRSHGEHTFDTVLYAIPKS